MRFWLVGSIAERGSAVASQVWPFVLVGVVAALACGRVLNALALGDDLARSLGQRVGRARAADRRRRRRCWRARRPRSPGRSCSSGWWSRTSRGRSPVPTTAGCSPTAAVLGPILLLGSPTSSGASSRARGARGSAWSRVLVGRAVVHRARAPAQAGGALSAASAGRSRARRPPASPRSPARAGPAALGRGASRSLLAAATALVVCVSVGVGDYPIAAARRAGAPCSAPATRPPSRSPGSCACRGRSTALWSERRSGWPGRSSRRSRATRSRARTCSG